MGLLVTRARSAFGLLTAAGLTLLLAATAVCVAVLYAQSVTQAGLATILGATAPQDRAITVRLDVDQRTTPEALTSWPGGLPVEVTTTVQSRRVALTTDTTQGTSVRVLAGEDLAPLLRVVDGTWPPSGGGGAFPVAVPVAAAAALRLDVGADLTFTRGDDVVHGVVAALVEPVDATDPAWAGSGTQVAGADPDAREPGPLLAAALPPVLLEDATVRWVALPDLGAVRVGQVPALLGHVQALVNRTLLPSDSEVDSTLDDVLGGIGTPLLVARSSVYLPAVLVVLSAGVALAIGARLVSTVRARELWLLRARGFSGRQLLGVSLGEALAVAAPAVALSPVLAGAALRALARWGPLAEAGLGGLGGVPPSTWWIAAAVGAGGVLALVLVGGRSRAQDDPERRPALQRAGVDVVVGVLALLACWQVLRYGAPLSVDRQGLLSVDPLLVVAPALVLLAGALVTMRLLLWAAHRLEGPAARSTGLAGALGAWQVGRRRARQAGPALLVVLAVGAAALSTTYAATWELSQRDQADLAVGADLRVDADGPAQQDAGAAGAYVEVPGVDDAMAVLTRRVYGDGLRSVLTAWDAERAPGIVLLRPDLGDLAGGDAALAAQRPEVVSVALPPGTQDVALRVVARVPDPAAPPGPVELAVVVRDAAGLLHRLAAREVAVDGAPHTLTFPLDGLDREVSGVELLAVEVAVDTSPAPGLAEPPRVEVDLTSAEAVTGAGTAPLPAPAGWRAAAPAGQDVPPTVDALRADGTFLQVSAQVGAPALPTTFTLRPTGAGDAVAGQLVLTDPGETLVVPVLSTPGLPGPRGPSEGDTTNLPRVNLLGRAVLLDPVGRLDAVPGQGLLQGATPGFVADLPTLSLTLYEASGQVLEPSAWWLSTTDRAAAADALAPPSGSQAELGPVTADRLDLRTRLRTDPLGAGVVTALLLALVGAGLCAAIGVGVAAVVAIRERRGEFALLQAVGTSPRQLRASLAVEQGLLLGTGVLLGGALGVLVARLLVPELLLDSGGAHPVPPVDVVVPWLRLVVVVGLVAAVLVLLVVLATRSAVRATLAASLRFEGTR